MSKVLNYTTGVAVTKTSAEVMALLAGAGAGSISVRYSDGEPSGLTFSLETGYGVRGFDLPVNWEGMQRRLAQASRAGQIRGGPSKTVLLSEAHARRVAWRVAKDWLEAQLALVAAQMVEMDQVMLPYMVIAPGTTLYARYVSEQKQLEA